MGPTTHRAGTSRARHDQAVLETLRATRTHPTAAEVFDAVRAQYPRIGRATVYRALQRLVAAGLVIEARRDALGCHYDARTDQHDHAICTTCGRVLDLPRTATFPGDGPLAALHQAARDAGLATAVRLEVRLYGICTSCLKGAREA